VRLMRDAKLSWLALAWLGMLATVAFGLGLGSTTRLTYHEAFVAQGAREILSSGHWWYPTIGGVPWLEKPPLPWWLVAGLGWCAGTVSPTVARLPSVVAAVSMMLGVSLLATRHYGAVIGILSAAIQATTAWTVLRGRLAEADILLACLLVWTLLAFDRIRVSRVPAWDRPKTRSGPDHWRAWRWAFFGLLGTTALVKGIGFGAALVLSVVMMVVFWDHDRVTRNRLLFPAGWIIVIVLAVTWPVAMIAEHGHKVISLWAMHITERVGSRTGHGAFAGETWCEYGLNIVAEALPWTPLAVIGAWPSFARALRGYTRRYNYQGLGSRGVNQVAGDRLLCSWAIAPLVLVSLASARSAHYAIYALIPWSIWAALGLARFGAWQVTRGWSPSRLRRLTWAMFTGLVTAYGLSFWVAGAWFNRRGTEWAFYETTGRALPPTLPLMLLYDDWDRDAYPTPFGPIPHDLAVRLYYLNRPACWHFDIRSLADQEIGKGHRHNADASSGSMMIIGRERDLPALRKLGQVEVLSLSSTVRWDRTYLLARVQPSGETATRAAMQSSLVSPIHR
jgi:4-amino-4-deoxy-L-arabinose transferase-like glycosyltransferase